MAALLLLRCIPQIPNTKLTAAEKYHTADHTADHKAEVQAEKAGQAENRQEEHRAAAEHEAHAHGKVCMDFKLASMHCVKLENGLACSSET